MAVSNFHPQLGLRVSWPGAGGSFRLFNPRGVLRTEQPGPGGLIDPERPRSWRNHPRTVQQVEVRIPAPILGARYPDEIEITLIENPWAGLDRSSLIVGEVEWVEGDAAGLEDDPPPQ